MPRTETRKTPMGNGGPSVLSGKATIMGMPKTQTARTTSSDPKHCKSVLEGPECVQGIRGKRQKKGQRASS